MTHSVSTSARFVIDTPTDVPISGFRSGTWIDPFGSGPPAHDLTDTIDAMSLQRMLGFVHGAWGATLLRALAVHPDPSQRIRAAVRTTSLVALKSFATDPVPEVRAAVTLNQLIVDADVQSTLAADPDERVVLALLHSRTPHRAACEQILRSRHSQARALLGSRRLSAGLLHLLEIDERRDPLGTSCDVTAASALAAAA